jgi:hypothetical protein
MPADNDPPSLDDLAKRYLDLWQDQMTAMAADPETARLMGRTLQLWAGAGPAGWQAIWQAAADGLKGRQGTAFDHGAFASFFPQTPGPAPAGPASGHGGGDVAELRRRLAELETRIAGLAQEPRAPRKGAGKRTRKSPGGRVS